MIKTHTSTTLRKELYLLGGGVRAAGTKELPVVAGGGEE